MNIHVDAMQDISDCKSHSYLQLNSCGYQIASPHAKTATRRDGRCDYHIFYLATGQCEVTYNGKTHLLTEGFVFYPPHTPQYYIDYENTTRMWLHFNGYQVEEILKEACLDGGVYSIASPILEKMFIQLIAEHSLCSPLSNEKGLLLTLLYTLGRLTNHSYEPNATIIDAVSFITTHYNTDISVSELAAYCNLSQSHFISLFKKQTGMAPHTYQQTLRLKNAMTLLTSTVLDISDIGIMCGYQDPLYFSRLFRKHVGLSPSSYRQQYSCAKTDLVH